MIPKNPLTVRKVVTLAGTTPPGSCGWGYCFPETHDDAPAKAWLISDIEATGRFWPMIYDEENDSLVAVGAGMQMQNGIIAEYFPLPPVCQCWNCQETRLDTLEPCHKCGAECTPFV